jgi:penicillin amidase
MTITKRLKITAIVISAVIIISVILSLAVYNFLQVSYDSNEKIEVDSTITITRDNKGIPVITAESVNDFYFALGYLHAQDRLDIIEYMRSIASGDSARFAGEDSALLNNLSITIGFTKNAVDILLKLKEEEISALTNYVRGINHLRKKNHVRNLISREWKIEDVLAVLSMKEWSNAYLNNKELIFNLPDTKIVSSKNLFNDNRFLYFYNEDDLQYLYTLRRIKEIIEKYICSFARGNSIHIPAEYSSSGNDSFTTLNYEDYFNIYPGWYPVRLELNGKKTYAVTYSGLPFIMSFKNDSVSLTQININADSQNFYLFDTDYRNNIIHYRSAGIWKEYKSVRIPDFSGNEVTSELKWITEKGPVISELINSTKKDSRIMVIDSILPGAEYVNLMLKIPFEADIEKIRQRTLLNDSSLKCFNISANKKAYKVYSGFLNQSENSSMIFINGSRNLKPHASKISVARQVTGPDYSGSDLTSIKDLPGSGKNVISNEFKIERFNSLLEKKKYYDFEKIKSIITDDSSVAAAKFAPLFIGMLGNNPLTSSKLSRIYLNDWDYSAKSGLQSPTIFYTALQFYISESYKDDFGKDSDFNLNSTYLLYPEFYKEFQKSTGTLFDKTDTPVIESRETIFDIAFLNAMRFLNRIEGPLMEKWKWGLINKSAYNLHDEKHYIISHFFRIEQPPLSGGPDTILNILHDNKFKTVSSTSFLSIMGNDAFHFKMFSGYSTSVFSDFYHDNNDIDEFQNISFTNQKYKTTFSNR